MAWHALDPAQAGIRLEVGPDGLDSAEAGHRLQRYGPNRLPPPRRRSLLRRLLAQFHNILIYLLLVAAVAAWYLGHPVDSAVIALVVLANAVIGFVQEGKAERAMEAIGQMVARQARVRRDGRRLRIDAGDLVPGDRVRLKPGDRVPADLRLLECHELYVDEAALTGESLPVAKHPQALAPETALAERACMAWSGTLVVKGEAEGLVVATGTSSEIGRITGLLGAVHSLATPLLRQIERFGRLLSAAILALAGSLVLLAWLLHGQGVRETFMAAVALAVSAIPEGLPAIITITLAVGVRRMAQRRAIVRRLPAVETLGSVDTICSDKTGTLTRNELQATHLVLGARLQSGDAWREGGSATLRELCETAVLACEADRPEAADPLESALLQLAGASGVDVAGLLAARPRSGLLPFASENKLMATRHGEMLYVKGAPERVLARCCTALDQARFEPADWQQQIQRMASDGLRVLALARGRSVRHDGRLELAALGDALELVGLVGFSDPPRAEVPGAIAACTGAGITVKMITGDHADTALAIAGAIGIDTRHGALSGHELDGLSPGALAQAALRVNVFARAAPEHKLRLVEALQAQGRIVAMTGDGVNDAPALKRADIGVAMGQTGTEAAREAADMVLADDHFATIVSGVEEGRGVYDNIRKAILFALPTNAGEAMVIFLAVVLGVTLPITPVQVLWINTVTAITLALALAFEPLESDVMRRAPRPRGQGLVDAFMLLRLLWVGALMTAGSFALYLAALAAGDDLAAARTVAFNTLVACELVYLFNARRWHAPSWQLRTLLANPWALGAAGLLVLLQLGSTYLPLGNRLLGTAPIGVVEWLWILGFAALAFILVEIEKAWLRRRSRGLH